MQVKSANSLEEALAIMDEASSINSMDAAGITSFVQSSDGDDDSDSGAPDAAVYEKHSGGIIDTLNGLLEDMLTVESEQLDRLRWGHPQGVPGHWARGEASMELWRNL